jgi:hypothetical protein
MNTKTRNVLAVLAACAATTAVAQQATRPTQPPANHNSQNTNTTTPNHTWNTPTQNTPAQPATTARPINSTKNSPSDPSQTALVELGQFGMANDNHFRFVLDTLGSWTTTTTWWPAPDAQPLTTQGTAEFSLMVGTGGKFVRQEFRNTSESQKFVGFAFYGFNNATSEYESVWFDSAASHMVVTHGTRAEDGSITYTGAFVDPRDGQRKTTRSVMAWPDSNTITYETFDTTSDGREFVSLRVTYTRVPRENSASNQSNTPTFVRPGMNKMSTQPKVSDGASGSPADTVMPR